MTDTDLLDILEAEMKDDPIVLWTGEGDYPGRPLRGLSLMGGRRTLREAIAALLPQTTTNGSLQSAGSNAADAAAQAEREEPTTP